MGGVVCCLLVAGVWGGIVLLVVIQRGLTKGLDRTLNPPPPPPKPKPPPPPPPAKAKPPTQEELNAAAEREAAAAQAVFDRRVELLRASLGRLELEDIEAQINEERDWLDTELRRIRGKVR